MPPAVTESESSELPTFQQAFEQAKEKHSTPEQAPPDGESTDTDEEETPPSPGDKAKPGTGTSKADKTGTDDELISDEEFSALSTKHADDSKALRKALEGVLTKKLQAVADQRRSVERLQQYTDLIDALEEDAPTAIRMLAEEHGVQLPTTTTETKAEPGKAEETAATAVTAIVDEFKQSLGPELEYLADGLAPAITKLVERLTQSTVQKTVDPLVKRTDALVEEHAQRETGTVMTAFSEKHPDWAEHEPDMLKLASKVQPNGMTELEFLEHLYTTVTTEAREKTRDADVDKKVAEGVKAALKKMEKGAASTESRTGSVPESQVQRRPAGTPTFHDAFEAAKRGERWED